MSKAGDEVIVARQLHKRFVEGSGASRIDVHVLQGIDLTVRRGETLAIVGASGSGKSTLLHLLGGLEAPTQGAVRLAGRDFSQMARQHLVSQGFEPLGSLERLYQITLTRSGDSQTFAGSIDLHPSTIQNCHDFFNGVRLLQENVLSAAPAGHVMGRVFEQMEELFRQRLHVRALGAYLLDIARATGVLRHTGRSLALTVGGEKGEADDVFVIAS